MFNKGKKIVILDNNIEHIKNEYINKVLNKEIKRVSREKEGLLLLFKGKKNRYYQDKDYLPKYSLIKEFDLNYQKKIFEVIQKNNLLRFEGRVLPNIKLLNLDINRLYDIMINDPNPYNRNLILNYLIELSNHGKILFPFLIEGNYLSRQLHQLKTNHKYSNNYSYLFERSILNYKIKSKEDFLEVFNFYKNNNLNKFQLNSITEFYSKAFNKYLFKQKNDFYDFDYGKYISYKNIIRNSFKTIDTDPVKYKIAIKHFFIYLNKLEQFNLENFNRLEHIFDPTNRNYTILEYCKKSKLIDSNINIIIGGLFKLSKYLIKKNIIKTNPIIPSEDTISIKINKNGTHRKSLNDEIIQEAKKILVSNNFEFTRLNYKKDIVESLYNFTTKKYDKNVFSPSTTIALYTLLEIPLRGIQVQFLDSGENDNYRYDFTKKKMVKNKDSKRMEGFIRKQTYETFEGEFYSLWVTTNKSITDGYEIPYLSDDYYDVLKYQYEFLTKYDPYPIYQDFSDIKRVGEAKELKGYNTLFRDLSKKEIKPIRKTKIIELWGLVCLELEQIFKRKGIHLSLTKKTVKGIKSKFDIHSLRVSGITNLLDKGVPLNIVSKYIAGHSSYFMTLWYNNPHPSKVREQLIKAKEKINKIEDEINEDRIEDFIGNTNYLIENRGMLNIGLSGICPFKDCANGGEQIGNSGKFNSVPMGNGKPNCFECRYFVTSKDFLAGQVLEGNILIKQIQKMTIRIDELKEKIMDYEDENDLHNVNLTKGELIKCETQYSFMVSEWWSRLKMFEKCKGDFKESSLANKSNFELLHSITTFSEIFNEVDNEVNQRELESLLNKFLIKNEIQPFLFLLDDKDKLRACNLLGDLILNLSGNIQIDKLISGDVKIDEIPELKEKINKLIGGKDEIKRLL